MSKDTFAFLAFYLTLSAVLCTSGFDKSAGLLAIVKLVLRSPFSESSIFAFRTLMMDLRFQKSAPWIAFVKTPALFVKKHLRFRTF